MSEYRDETRLEHMLEADIPALLPKLEEIVAGLPPAPPQPKNLMMFL